MLSLDSRMKQKSIMGSQRPRDQEIPGMLAVEVNGVPINVQRSIDGL